MGYIYFETHCIMVIIIESGLSQLSSNPDQVLDIDLKTLLTCVDAAVEVNLG